MRTVSRFLEKYRELAPQREVFRNGRNREAARVDLALHLLTRFLPDESVDAVPFLLSGYPTLAGEDPSLEAAIKNLRHYCAEFASSYAWGAALDTHEEVPEINRTYRVEGRRRAVRRQAAPDALIQLLEETLRHPAPYVERKLTLAKPGPGRVYVDQEKTRLDYLIPLYREEDARCMSYDLVRRRNNPPIAVRWSALMDSAREVDRVEGAHNWSAETGLQPLNLVKRLDKVRLVALHEGLFRDGILTLEGATHLVGMLSSGKSTLVLALLFTLARPEYGKKTLVIAPDTTAAAQLSMRLKAHGISATVLASFANRDKHLSAIHWHQAMTSSSGWSVSGMGDLISDFGVACPLDGHQTELRAVTGADRGERRFPRVSEKPCYEIKQEAAPEDTDQESDTEDREGERRLRKRSCPLYAGCPAQMQQRSAVQAQVVVMTAPAFMAMSPDRHVLRESLSFPELVQFTRDLVIVDEADAVQCAFDDHFTLDAPIMGIDERSYLPQSAVRVHSALQEQGGAQYASRLNVAWQGRLSRLEIAVSGLYSLLLNRWADVAFLKLESEFTTGTILWRLWKKRSERLSGERDIRITRDTEVTFEHILAMAGALSSLDEPDPLAREEEQEEEHLLERLPEGFKAAAFKLAQLRAQLRNGVDWRSLMSEAREVLSGPLRDFNIFEFVEEEGKRERRADRNALAILAALYANIVLSTFSFLARNHAAVSAAFKLDEYTLLDETRNLIRQYRPLVPESPGGNVFGLVYEPKPSSDVMGGELKLLSNLGVGRYLLTHLHALLRHEDQAGPHVLLLSGTSWAGGRMTLDNSRTEESADTGPFNVASPSYDIQVPVTGYLEQPEQERKELDRSVFELVPVPDKQGRPLSVSGQSPEWRRLNLERIAEYLVAEVGRQTRLELRWTKNADAWNAGCMKNRTRALLVVQSYKDAAVVANAIQRQIKAGLAPGHSVFALVSDDQIRGNAVMDPTQKLELGVTALPRSLVEDFGRTSEGSILVAPLSVVARGHNILNSEQVAAVSSIYFLHRPHPRPDDRSSIIGQMNRFALDCLNGRVAIRGSTVLKRGKEQRVLARQIARRAQSARSGYSMMPPEEQARFAWDLLTPLWQTIGRGIRGGVPIYVGFIDAKFSPGSVTKDTPDTPETSCLRQILAQLRMALSPALNPSEHEIAAKLYRPLHACLQQMFDQMEYVATSHSNAAREKGLVEEEEV